MIGDKRKTASIANGASLSAAVSLETGRLFALQMPASWTTANLTFQASHDGTTYADMYDEEGTEVTVTAAASRVIVLEPARWLGIRCLKVRSGTSGSPVNQGAAREITLLLAT